MYEKEIKTATEEAMLYLNGVKTSIQNRMATIMKEEYPLCDAAKHLHNQEIMLQIVELIEAMEA